MPRIGARAPDFELPDQDGVVRKSRDFRGRWLALYFYPRDDTPGCTRQAVCFRDAQSELLARGVAVCGVSVDDVASHQRFARKYKVQYPLVADPDGAVAARYGSLADFGYIRFARRNLFLIDPEGHIASVRRGVSPTKSAAAVLGDVIDARKVMTGAR